MASGPSNSSPGTIPQVIPRAAYFARRDEIDVAIARTLERGIYVLGEEVRAFEREFADYLGVAESIGVASGTDAIELALRAVDVGLGDAVFTVSHTAVATVAAIERTGATPVLVDVAPQTFVMDVESLADAIAETIASGKLRPRAIVPVHLYGHPAPMVEILDIARWHGLCVVEDCAQAHGAKLDGQRVGSFGHLSAFSFYPTKNLGGLGDGGLVATSDPQLAERVRALRQYGWRERFISAEPGVNSRLDELQAAVLRVGLRYLDADNARRREIAARYDAELNGAGLLCPIAQPEVEHVYHQYVVRCDQRDELRQWLADRQIGAAIHYPLPVHQQPAYMDRFDRPGRLVETGRLSVEILSLPMFPQLTDAEVDRVIDACRAFCRRKTCALEALR